MRNYLITAEVAKVLAVSEVSLSNWRIAGVGPPSVKRGKEFHYPKNAFRDYLESLTGGDPVPRGLTSEEKRRLFARLHRNEPPLDDGPSRAELANRLAVVEAELAKLKNALLNLQHGNVKFVKMSQPGSPLYSVKRIRPTPKKPTKRKAAKPARPDVFPY